MDTLLLGGWPTLPLWKMMDFVTWDYDIPNWMENEIHVKNMKVSWDYEIPNWMESHNPFMFQTTKQFLFL